MFGMKLSPAIQCDAPAFKNAISPQVTCKNTSQSTQDQKYQNQSIILYQRIRSLIITLQQKLDLAPNFSVIFS